MTLLKLASFLVVAYLTAIAGLYLAQTWLLFPARLTGDAKGFLPDRAESLQIGTPDGYLLRGVRISPAAIDMAGFPTIIGFGGNAWNADYLAAYLHMLFPQAEIITFHYRGYPPSTGTPGASAILADALLVYDNALETAEERHVVAVGFSLGSAVAAYLAARRPVKGLVMVSPFDTLEELVRSHVPWAPTRLLLKHNMPVTEYLRGLQKPVAIIAAADDTIVPPERTAQLRKTVRALVFDLTIKGAGHNEIYDRADFRRAIVEAMSRVIGNGSGGA